MSDTMQPNVEVAMFILLAIVIPVVAFFGIKWLVFRPTRLTIHPAGGAFMRVPRGRRRYILFGPRLPPDPSRNRGSRSHRQRTVVVIRDLESGLHGGSAVHSHTGAANTPNASTTAISGSACSCAHDHHGHDGGSEHYIADPDDRELHIKRARTTARGGTAFGPVAVATADPRTNTIRAPHFIPDNVSSSAHASTVSADGGIVPATTATIDHAAKTADGRQALRRPLSGTIIRGPRGMSVRVRKASENLKRDAADDAAAAANGGAAAATPGSPVVTTPGSLVVTPASPVSPGSPITPSSPVGTPGSPVVITPGTPVASGALPAPATPSSPPASPITPASPTSSGTANTVDRATAVNTAANANATGRMTAAQANAADAEATAAANAASFEANSAIPVDPRHFANLAATGNDNNGGGVPVPGDFEIPAPAVGDAEEGGASSGGGRVVAFAAESAKGL